MLTASEMRWLRVAAAVAAILAVQLTAASVAGAIDGRERRLGTSAIDDEPYKVAVAKCSSKTKRVVGGGAAIREEGRKRVRLVGLIPHTTNGAAQDGFTAIAEAPDLYSPYDWEVAAYAICVDADELSRHQIVSAFVDVPTTGGPFEDTAARCPSGTIAYSAGGQIIATGHNTFSLAAGKIGLQLNRTSGPQDISRTTARERAEGTQLPWRLVSYAVCAKPPAEMNIRGTSSLGDEAKGYCDSGWDVIGPGGGGGLTDGGPSWLQDIIPQASIQSTLVRMTAPLYPSIGGMIVHMTCAL
jgi:hypothetical protein